MINLMSGTIVFPATFPTNVPIPGAIAVPAAVDLLEESGELVQRLWDNTRTFSGAMKKMGFDIGHSQTPIVPLMLGDAALAKKFSRALFEQGVFAVAIAFPTVPVGKARIRVMNSASHSPADLETALAVFEKVGKDLGVIA